MPCGCGGSAYALVVVGVVDDDDDDEEDGYLCLVVCRLPVCLLSLSLSVGSSFVNWSSVRRVWEEIVVGNCSMLSGKYYTWSLCFSTYN